MRRLMVSAMASGSGKTVLACGLLAAFKRRGVAVEAFKCGPDYIDPLFHSRVLGVASRNLDPFLQGEAGVGRTLARQRADLGLIEGAMGYYDGVGFTDRASAWQVAGLAGASTVLAVRPRGASTTLAAQLGGMLAFREPSRVAGAVLCDCRPAPAARLARAVERECGLPVLGFVPPMDEARLESRHLGLVGADEAFCFYYEDALDALRACGARLAFFSPLHDGAPPAEADGLYLGGGYPELHARGLSANAAMRGAVRDAVRGGMPTVAECGGFLYLQGALQDPDGREWPMAGAFEEGLAFRTGSLQNFGYAYATAHEDTMLVRRGERVPVHEFHYWSCTACGGDLEARRPDGRSWRFGRATPTLYAGFPHMHLAGELPLAERFVDAAASWREGRLP